MTSDICQDTRLQILLPWLDKVLPDHSEPVPASSDASFRRYFRVFSGELANQSPADSYIVMDAPPAQEDCRPFVAVSQALIDAGVRVPKVLKKDIEQGFLLLDDLGDSTFLSALNAENADQAYRKAIDSLLLIQATPCASLPAYSAGLLLRELALFHDWYLGVHHQRVLSAAEQQAWDELCQLLIARATKQTQVFVHRDYHSRNLMWSQQQPFGILDFQDAVCGPLSYDLVSLLRDCYIAWPKEQVDQWCGYYLERSRAAGILVPSEEEFAQDFDWMGLQRHLKAIGIFARLNHRDGKSAYLNDVPRTLGYVAQVAAQYPELALLHDIAEDYLA
ncbi:MAG: aminoglycoside phosphotransferase family protein [Oceanococcus sp.]